ncbi:GroES-like protein [Lentinus tigrinus ALCF2SS1-7]|uniref:GroES-like protein n=1 Tax=Lentinus tigrinus ALCF2SS1-6 TaxID=1328759 RepID=A0A5C2S9A3_9APHY|nr:GroES-like protein [Lentinus tigrinus ALCF2SS1-6]RPD69563.1 GroES-like protein [Lentinus tigrinus ALCF2SS1-7]
MSAIPTKQKALFLESKLGQFNVSTTDVPKPGPDDVLVKIEATALNPLDWKVQKYGLFVEVYPTVLGFDAAGRVVAVGENVTSFAVGDRVIVQGWYNAAKAEVHGTFLEYYDTPAKFVSKIPESISYDEAATIPSGLATAAFPLYNTDSNENFSSAKLLPPWVEGGRGQYAGKPILILAGATSIGQFVIQLARLSGFSPIITTASLHNAPFLKSLGATHVIDRKLPAEQLKAEATKLGGGLFEYVYDAVSVAETLELGYALTAPKGDFMVVLSGAELKAAHPDTDKRIHMAHGLFASPVNHEIGASLLAAVPELFASGDLKPNRPEVLPGGLNGIVGGLERLYNDQVSGVKLVVRPPETA